MLMGRKLLPVVEAVVDGCSLKAAELIGRQTILVAAAVVDGCCSFRAAASLFISFREHSL